MSYMIEGKWIGYRSSQDHVVHRTYGHSKKFADKVLAIGYGIRFTDGTTLELNVVERRRPKKYNEIHGYDDLIRDCADLGVSSVSEVIAGRRKAIMGDSEKNVSELFASF